MFPESTETQLNPISEKYTGGTAVKFDYTTNRVELIDGRPVTFLKDDTKGKVKQWVELLLKTEIDKFRVYKNTNFGIAVNDIIGFKSFDTIAPIAVLEQEIKEKVKLNSDILEVTNFNATQNNQILNVTLTILLVQGGVINVTTSRFNGNTRTNFK